MYQPATTAPAIGLLLRRAAAALVNVARHAVPLVTLYLHGNFKPYLLLTAFDLALGLMLIVGTTREGSDPTSVDPRSRGLVMRFLAIVVIAVFLGLVAGIVAIPIFVPALILGSWGDGDWGVLVRQPNFWVPVAGMSLFAACQAQLWFESTTRPGARGAPSRAGPVIGDVANDRKISLAAYAGQVTLIASYVALCFAMIFLGRFGLFAFPAIYTALIIFYDLRPDMARRILPDLWNRQ